MIKKIIAFTDEDQKYIRNQVAQLKFLKAVIEKDVKKPKKPLRKRVSKKYKKMQADYLDIIEKFNKRNEMLLLSFDIIIAVHENFIL